MKIIKLPFWSMVFVLLAGCSVNPVQPLLQATQTRQTQSSLPASQATSPTEPFLPRATPSLPIAEVSPTQLATNFHIQTHCPGEKLGIHNLPELPGTVVFGAENNLSGNNILSPEPGKSPTISFWQPQSGKISAHTLEEDEIYYYYVESPDKEKLAYTQGKTSTISYDLVVLDRQGKELGRVPLPDDWTFDYWRNNEQHLLQRFKAKENFDLAAISFADKTRQSLSTNFPGIYLDELLWNWGSQVLFNSQETLVLYPIRQHNPEQLYSVLWNVKERKEVARIEGGQWARWSPDGNHLLLTKDVEDKEFGKRNDMILLNASGEQFRATFFAKYYEKVWIEQPTWSPDNHLISFWLIKEYPVKTGQLGVLDTETLTVHLFCKEIDPRPRPLQFDESYALGYEVMRVNGTSPIWSPDSHYLLVEDNNGIESSTFLYDLRNDTVTKIADNARPVGWLK